MNCSNCGTPFLSHSNSQGTCNVCRHITGMKDFEQYKKDKLTSLLEADGAEIEFEDKYLIISGHKDNINLWSNLISNIKMYYPNHMVCSGTIYSGDIITMRIKL